MSETINVKQICEFIWDLEDKYNLLDYEINGIKFWQIIRFDLYYEIVQKIGLYSQPHTKLSTLQKIKYVFFYLLNSLQYNYLTLKRNVDIVFFPHPRVVNVDGEFIDIYTKYLIDDLKKNNGIIEFERAYLGRHWKKKTDYVHYTDWIELLGLLFEKFIVVKYTTSDIVLINKIQNEMKKTLNINLNLKSFISNKIKRFSSLYRIYNIVFKKIKPKTCYVVVSYSYYPVIKAAKDNNVEVIELQHGTITKYHLAYSYPGLKKSLCYFPDKIYVWNKFWKNVIKYPVPEENVIIDKFRYLEYQKQKYNELKKDKNQIVVISQGTVGDAIAQLMLKNIDFFKKYKVIFKLHPGEFDRWEGYPHLRELIKNLNVKVVRNEIPLYELFATSDMQVGVYSTALYEGVEFGCKTILLNLPGIENMENFIKEYDNVTILS